MSLTSQLLTIVQLTGVFVGVLFSVYLTVGIAGSMVYEPSRAAQRADNVRFVITTVAAEHVRDALFETVEHTTRSFPEYDLYCLVDEGSDLQPELEAVDGVEVVVVPETYECEAIAKGRAINYFIETVVAAAPDYWYAFIDDDNQILDDRFFYEIPHYEARGYRAMNPVLVPRQGRSVVTFMTDHIRFVDDITIYRLFTGLLGRPYLGFHGELLCARGDVLVDIGFDRETIVEDFAFALEVAKRDIPVWQSATRVSVLSPHDVTSFLKQRSRWYLGIARYLPRAPHVSQIIVGVRIAIWTVAVTSSWVLLPLWIFADGLSLPLWSIAILGVGSLIYISTVGLGAWRIGGLKGASLMLLTPVYATLEQVVPLYALWTGDTEFVVIEK
jgi:cellulose synthase/poly-beta-1,6-N-acetylglucosamine synthase-like glycosyltransferase